MLHHPILRLGEICREVVVVLAPDVAEPPMPAGVPVRIARDPTEGAGPLVGLLAGLRVLPSPVALVTGGDMPDPQTRVLLEMLRVANAADVDAVVLQDADRYRPLPCVVRVGRAVQTADALLSRGRRRLLDLLDAMRRAVIDEETWVELDPDRRTLFDVDEPSDLDER